MGAVGYVVAGGLGGLLAVAELLSRYRDHPRRVATRAAAWVYIAVNVAASVAALYLAVRFGWDFGQERRSRAQAVQVLVAGLGAAALFRSSLFMVKVGDEDVGVGPNLVLQSLLAAADRSVDRDQAQQRLQRVGEATKDMDFDKAHAALVTACLGATASVSAEDAAALHTSVEALANAPMTNRSKALALGMLIADVVGCDVLSMAIIELGDEITVEPSA
jgi:hypothetical protein